MARTIVMLAMIVLLLPGAGMAPNAGGPLQSVFMLDTGMDAWVPLPPVNDFASVGIGVPVSGACDKENWPVPITQRVRIECDKEVVKTATPLTTDRIRTLPDGTFQVPVFTEVSWRVHIQVANVNLTAISNVAVSDRFGAEYAVAKEAVSQGSVTLTTTGAANKVHLSWTIGNLAPGAVAWLDLIVTTKRNPGCKQEFTSCGNYLMNSGATLKYELNGIQMSATSGTIRVQAVSQAAWAQTALGWGQKDLAPLRISPLVIGGLGAQSIDNIQGSIVGFSQEFAPISEGIVAKYDDGGAFIGFEVPEGLRVEWRLTLTVTNTLDHEITRVKISSNLGAELEVDLSSAEVTPGLADQVPPGGPFSTLAIYRAGNMKIDWTVDRLPAGDQAVLTCLVFTGVNGSGQQQYVQPGQYWMNSIPTLKYIDLGKQQSVVLDPIPIWVVEGGFLQVNLSATRYDWQVRKPGTYVIEPTLIGIYSNRQVAVSFSGFADLASRPPGDGSIPVFYAFGDTLAGVDSERWISAPSLNTRVITTTSNQAGGLAILRMWTQLRIPGAVRAGEYQNMGTMTFTVLENRAYVAGSVGEVVWPTFAVWSR